MDGILSSRSPRMVGPLHPSSKERRFVGAVGHRSRAESFASCLLVAEELDRALSSMGLAGSNHPLPTFLRWLAESTSWRVVVTALVMTLRAPLDIHRRAAGPERMGASFHPHLKRTPRRAAGQDLL